MPARKSLKLAALLTASLLSAVALAAFLQAPTPPPLSPQPVQAEISPAPTVLDEYGIETDIFRTAEHQIRRSQTFSEILSAHDVPAETIHRLAEEARPVFNVRHLQAGRPYRVYRDDSTATYLVYEKSPVDYVVFDLRDSLRVYEGQRPVQTRRRAARGTITNSLYQSLVEQDVDPALAIQLAEMYAWQIDFYRIQHGDRFAVIYEEQTIDDQPIGLGNIVAARFTHADRDYYGFRFEQDGRVDYFDEEGNSLRKALLKAPLKYSARITSRYTKRRFHPVQKRYKAHLGTDYAAPRGTPIISVGDGVIQEAQFKKFNGNYVKIRHNGTYTTGYLHMSRIASGIRPGAHVRQGQVIGYVGSTGLATGPHVCYRFWKHGVQVDPLREELPSSNPVLASYRPAFGALQAQLLPMLEDAPAPMLAARPATLDDLTM